MAKLLLYLWEKTVLSVDYTLLQSYNKLELSFNVSSNTMSAVNRNGESAASLMMMMMNPRAARGMC